MVKRVKDPEDQEVVPVKWYQRRRCTDDTCAIASCCSSSGSREEITIVASVKDTKHNHIEFDLRLGVYNVQSHKN
jgi:hypothetical protein